MRVPIESVVGNHSMYRARGKKYDTGQRVPFRVSPTPLVLSRQQKNELVATGKDITSYFQEIDELYQTNTIIRNILNIGKPDIFITKGASRYLFIRPDIIISKNGFTVCEIETSLFGLALAEVLNRAYLNEGFGTLVERSALLESVKKQTPTEGTIIYTDKTASYAGQMAFLAEQIFSGTGRNWQAQPINKYTPNIGVVYRGFYLEECASDSALRACLAAKNCVVPSATPHMEEKAILAFIWDRRFETLLKTRLGLGAFHHLRDIIPPTWIVGQEKYFTLGLPNGAATSTDIASLSRSKRTFVLKNSGYHCDSSWSEGVNFLHTKSADGAKRLLLQASQDCSSLYILQEFRKGKNIPMCYEHAEVTVPMSARVRLTPYFSLSPGSEGELLACKATGCENTDFIHASSVSINTAVS